MLQRVEEVSIPFRADTGLEPLTPGQQALQTGKFQSLSGLSLGLNRFIKFIEMKPQGGVSIPFRAVTGLEPPTTEPYPGGKGTCFNPFQGCHWA